MGAAPPGPPPPEEGLTRGASPDVALSEPDDLGLNGGVFARAFSALSDHNFRLLYLGNMLQFGSQQMQLLVRGYLVFQLTGSFALLGTMALANAIPGVLLSPVGGILADRAPKKTVIQLAQGFNAINAAVLALLAWGGLGVHLAFWHLFLSSFLQGGINSLMMPARQSIISDLVGPRRLMNAIGINSSGQTLMQLFGPAAGGFLIRFLSPSAVFWTMAAMYALAVTFTVRLPAHPLYSYDRHTVAGRPRRHRAHGSFSDIADGMVYVWRDPIIRPLIGVNFLIVVVAMPYTMLLPGFVQAVLHRGGFEQGMLQAVQGVGAVVGSFIVASASAHGRGKMMILWGALLGVSLVAFASSSNYWITMPIMLVIGLAQTGRQAIGQVLIQTYASDEYRGRVTAVWFMQFSMVQFGTFFVGVLSELFGAQIAIGGLAALMALAMGVVWISVPQVRDLD
ncbi:MAG: MFS transporter [Dehalococcoidia bacterium]